MFRGRKITGATEKRQAKNTRFSVRKKVVYQKKEFFGAAIFAALCIPESSWFYVQTSAEAN